MEQESLADIINRSMQDSDSSVVNTEVTAASGQSLKTKSASGLFA